MRCMPRLPKRPPPRWQASVGVPRRGEGAAQTRFELQRPAGVPHLDLGHRGGAVHPRCEGQKPGGAPHPTTGPGGGAAHPRSEGQRPVGVPHPAMKSTTLPTQPRTAIVTPLENQSSEPLVETSSMPPPYRPPRWCSPPSQAAASAPPAEAPKASARRGQFPHLARKPVSWTLSPTTCRPSPSPPAPCPTSTDSGTANQRRKASSAGRGFCEEAVTARQATRRRDAAPGCWRRRAATPLLVGPNQPPPRQTAAASSVEIPRPKPTRFGW